MVDPLPFELVTSGRDLTEPRLAPIGRPQVGFVQGGQQASIVAVWLDGTAGEGYGGGGERKLTFGPPPAPGRGMGGGCFTWIARGEELSFAYVAVDGSLWWQRGYHLVRLDGPSPRTGRAHDGPPGSIRSCRAPSVDAAGSVLIYAVDEVEVWVVDLDGIDRGIASGMARRRVDDGRHAFCFDPVVAPEGRLASWQGWNPPYMPWDNSSRVDVNLATGNLTELRFDDAAIQQPRFTASGAAVHVDDRSGWLNVSSASGAIVVEPVEHAEPTWGMGNRSYAFGPDDHRVAVTRNERGFGGLVLHDLSRGSRRRLGRGVHGHLDWVGDMIAAIRAGARIPTQVVVYRIHRAAETDRCVVAGSAVDAWPTADLPEPEQVDVRLDPIKGRSSPAEFTRVFARRYTADTNRMLVWVHGGPTDQWRVDWRPRIHYWWSRGWNVLVVDPRGTTGHGRAYQQALHGGWGRLDVDDTAAAIHYVHDVGWASPASTVIIGGSSGGLTALGVLADHPELVAGAVTSYPVSDLCSLADATHRFEAHYTDTLVGPNDGSAAADERFASLSPISRTRSMVSPLLVFHGADDPVVPVKHSRELVRRIRVAQGTDADVELVVYDREGHGFRDPVNVADEYSRTEAFLDRVVDCV